MKMLVIHFNASRRSSAPQLNLPAKQHLPSPRSLRVSGLRDAVVQGK